MTNKTNNIRPAFGNRGGQMCVNVTADNCACTINTRYEAMALPKDILSLAHYPKTVVLIEL